MLRGHFLCVFDLKERDFLLEIDLVTLSPSVGPASRRIDSARPRHLPSVPRTCRRDVSGIVDGVVAP